MRQISLTRYPHKDDAPCPSSSPYFLSCARKYSKTCTTHPSSTYTLHEPAKLKAMPQQKSLCPSISNRTAEFGEPPFSHCVVFAPCVIFVFFVAPYVCISCWGRSLAATGLVRVCASQHQYPTVFTCHASNVQKKSGPASWREDQVEVLPPTKLGTVHFT